ncbi:serine hydrolase domain-containing protein [Streptomyces sp. DSM 40750]|uniref:serine hydrolase domain-containing protein n=1 Tax=Streptomyces sp. DSM 40750 TaxID=2801030 RepID=UPI00214AE703|nr:serine hydrolase [Streptomyces sp. DSM 40750]UUU19166.1 beta-lactamase family protein [Streptomyces sp. DSM 40750]UUU27490.1 beta-lactamase family protein [Streptomyces sp. DSM 40750]
MTEQQDMTLADLGFFTGVPQHDHLCRMKDLLKSREMAPAARPYVWPEGEATALPETYVFDGASRSSKEFLTDTDTAAVLVLIDGVVRHESYFLTGGPDVQWLSMSVAKSFVSALVGIAVAEGHIAGIDDPISSYVRVEPGSAYDGVSIKDVLQMSSGARWNEDYSDVTSDVYQLSAATMGIGGTLDDFVARMVPESEPGTVCRYNSGETQVLGALVALATGRSVADYMREKLCEPLGMTSAGYWLIDPAGTEFSFAGLNLTARDYARIGELYRNGGKWQGRQIVPAEWVRDSVTVTATHLEPGRPLVGGHQLNLGYGYQWWLPDGDRGEFSAIGVYNQFVYVDPAARTTIVKLSANRRYGTSTEEATNRDMETVAFLRAIARQDH